MILDFYDCGAGLATVIIFVFCSSLWIHMRYSFHPRYDGGSLLLWQIVADREMASLYMATFLSLGWYVCMSSGKTLTVLGTPGV